MIHQQESRVGDSRGLVWRLVKDLVLDHIILAHCVLFRREEGCRGCIAIVEVDKIGHRASSCAASVRSIEAHQVSLRDSQLLRSEEKTALALL